MSWKATEKDFFLVAGTKRGNSELRSAIFDGSGQKRFRHADLKRFLCFNSTPMLFP